MRLAFINDIWGYFFFHLYTWTYVFLFCCKIIFPSALKLLAIHGFGFLVFFFFWFSTHDQGNLVRWQFIKRLVGRIIGFNLLFSIYNTFFFLKQLYEKCQTIADILSGCIHQVLKSPLSQWDSFVCNFFLHHWKIFHEQTPSWWPHGDSDILILAKSSLISFFNYFKNWRSSLYINT